MTTHAQYGVTLSFSEDHSMSLGGFPGEAVDELMAILFEDPRARTKIKLTEQLAGKIVEWHRSHTSGIHSDSLRELANELSADLIVTPVRRTRLSVDDNNQVEDDYRIPTIQQSLEEVTYI